MAPSILTNLGCAGGAAVITVTFIHPIDTVKTRLQVSGTGNARNYAELGLAGTCSTIAKEEGIAAFWKGIPATAVALNCWWDRAVAAWACRALKAAACCCCCCRFIPAARLW